MERRLIAVMSASPHATPAACGHGCGDKPPAQCLRRATAAPFPGPVAGQFDLHVAIKLFCQSSAPLAVLISAQQITVTQSGWLRSTCEKGFCPHRQFWRLQHNFVRVQRFQVTNRTHAFATQRMVPTSIMSTSSAIRRVVRRRYP